VRLSAAFRAIPITEAEIRTIAANVPPYALAAYC
jgi:hypothetical protein